MDDSASFRCVDQSFIRGGTIVCLLVYRTGIVSSWDPRYLVSDGLLLLVLHLTQKPVLLVLCCSLLVHIRHFKSLFWSGVVRKMVRA